MLVTTRTLAIETVRLSPTYSLFYIVSVALVMQL